MLAESELEPLILADGSRIDPTTGKKVKDKKPAYIEVPSGADAQALVVKTRRTVAELPAPPQQMHAVALVAFYTLFGLPVKEIALAVDGRLTIEQIELIKKSDAYCSFMESAKTNIIETSADQVRDLFQQNAIKAASTVLNLVESDNDVLAFKASQDVLDRAGHRPADIVEHKHSMNGGLHIVITRKDENATTPIIDMPLEDYSNADDK